MRSCLRTAATAMTLGDPISDPGAQVPVDPPQ